VKSVWGNRPQLPRRIRDAVVTHARELGRGFATDDLFLLALAGLDEAQAARRALAEEGVDAARVLAEIRVSGDQPSDPPRGMTFAPAYYVMEGRAEGFAAALGHVSITPEDVLLSLIWDPVSQASQLLWRLGVSRESIVERLRRFGVGVPAAPLPVQEPIEYGEKVWFDRSDVARVLDHVRLNIPPGTRWGFNYADDRAWAFTEASVDLETLVKAALDASPGRA
jgi:hypothetical protein